MVGSRNIQNVSVTGGDAVEATISGLSLSNGYFIKVAATSGKYGIGVYSSLPITAMTDGERNIVS